MNLALKKLLLNILVLMVVMLPLRAMSMPIDMSSSHCMSGDMAAEMSGDMSGMDHTMHQMPATDDEQSNSCDCCKQCVSHCTTCASMTAVTFDLLQLSDIKTRDIYVVTTETLFTHITSPPSRPPLILSI